MKPVVVRHGVMFFVENMSVFVCFPRHAVIFSDDEWDVQSPPKRIVFSFYYHSQKVIGSLGVVRGEENWIIN